MKLILLACLGTGLLCGGALAQGSDACGSAQAISGAGFFSFNNTVATQDGSADPLCYEFGTSDIDNDVWFAWTCTMAGDYLVTTCNTATNDTKIAIYDGPNCLTSPMIDCNDDTCGLQSQVVANGLLNGSTYLIRIGSFPTGTTGSGQFEVAAFNPPSNDACANATPIAGTGFFNFDNTAATQDGAPDALCYKFGTSNIAADVWFVWTAPSNDDFYVSTCSVATSDTKIAIYDGPVCFSSPMIDCNDDAVSGMCGLQSEVFAFGVTAGSSYLVRIGSFPGGLQGAGQFEIDVFVPPPPPPPNDDCANAESISGCGSYLYDTTWATDDGLGDPLCYKFGTSQISHDVWFSWRAPATGLYTLDTCIAGGIDTKLAVYEDLGVCPPSPALDCNDDTCGLLSTISWNANGGQSYLLRIGTFPSAPGAPGFFDLVALAGCTPTSIGTNYCISTVNSTGAASTISATGTASISANDLILSADNLPGQPGIFIAGPGQAQLPFFNGFLCINPNGLQRFVNTTAPTGGVISEPVDYATSALGGLNVVAGSAYNYQRWNRDPAGGGTNANFSNGLEIAHTP